MDLEKNILEVWKERILSESKNGDRMKACRNVGVSYTTHHNAYDTLEFIHYLKTLRDIAPLCDKRQ